MRYAQLQYYDDDKEWINLKVIIYYRPMFVQQSFSVRKQDFSYWRFRINVKAIIYGGS